MRSINKAAMINKDQGEVKVEFSGKNLTSYGGLGLFSRFSRKLGIEKVLDKIKINENGEGGYKTGRKIMSLIYGLICDLSRPSDTGVLKKDKVLQHACLLYTSDAADE